MGGDFRIAARFFRCLHTVQGRYETVRARETWKFPTDESCPRKRSHALDIRLQPVELAQPAARLQLCRVADGCFAATIRPRLADCDAWGGSEPANFWLGMSASFCGSFNTGGRTRDRRSIATRTLLRNPLTGAVCPKFLAIAEFQ